MGLPPDRKTALKRAGGRAMARLIRLVERTSAIITDPPDLKARLAAGHPLILACWHGQFMMLVHLNPPGNRTSAMVARHGDAELIGQAMAALDVELIRGAGAGGRKKDRGGVHALRAAVAALTGSGGRPPSSLVMTADVPPGPARRAGEGIITIARLSGCPIVPCAAASSRYYAFKTWSRLTINLPWSRLGFAGGDPICVPRDADPATCERLRQQLEDSLNAVTRRAYQLAGADPARATPPNPASDPLRPGLLAKTYKAAMSAARPLARPLLAYRVRQGKEIEARLPERRGIASRPRPEGPLLWFHAASVGETNAVLPLMHELAARRPDAAVLLTTATVTSSAIAAARLFSGAIHQFAPLDAPEYSNAFLDHWRPDIMVLTEKEIWPSHILAASARHIPLVLVNAAMSDASFKRWRRLPGLAGPVFSSFDCILAQNAKLARRFMELGARKVVPAGNLKADAPPPPVDAGKLAALKAALGFRPSLLAASTHDGEEAVIAAAHALLARDLPGFCTILSPRHPERGEEVARLLTAAGLTVARRSLGEPLTPATNVYLADTLGELGTLFMASPVSLIGGSLTPLGGHNPFEAVSLGPAVLSGPSVHNFRDEYAALDAAGGVVFAATAEEIRAAVLRLYADPAARAGLARNACEAVDGLKGALAKTVDTILPLLPAPPQTGAAHAEPLAHAT